MSHQSQSHRAPRVLLAVLLSVGMAAGLGLRVEAAGSDTLLAAHLRVMAPVGAFFAQHTVQLDFLEDDPADGKVVNTYCQGGQFRSEYHWLGFTEVFAYDGAQFWYGSDLVLPYELTPNQVSDVTAQFISFFEYLQPAQQQYITAADVVPLNLTEHYAVLRYSPPGMSEALLLLDPRDYRLAGALKGSERRLADSGFYTLTRYEEWANFGSTLFPTVTRTTTLTPENETVRERYITAQSIKSIGTLEARVFTPAASPAVPRPQLPEVPFEVPFSFVKDTVVLDCLSPKGADLRLELDTGANVGLFTRDVAGRLGLELVGDEEVTGHGGAAAVQYARASGIRLKGAKRGAAIELPAYPAAVFSKGGGLDDSLADAGVSGLIGNYLLNNFVVKLDYRRRRMALYPLDGFNPALHLGKNYHAIPVQRASMPFVQVNVDEVIKGGAFFNTGAQQYFTLQAWAVDAVGKEYEIETVGTGITVKGYTVFGIIRPDKVALGDMVLTQPRTHMELLAPGESPNPDRIASFGNDFFQKFIVTFDLYHDMYYIEEM